MQKNEAKKKCKISQRKVTSSPQATISSTKSGTAWFVRRIYASLK